MLNFLTGLLLGMLILGVAFVVGGLCGRRATPTLARREETAEQREIREADWWRRGGVPPWDVGDDDDAA